ncbi:hypothetical protein [Frigidibacter oleivorans]|uniref:hypothetical protein n=1 Tax=Frigidibacter oleivorans TaxID=2487129 RepID=UPI000F8F23AB|nr:hypothetical protein [Frigidibacter oleivorans]
MLLPSLATTRIDTYGERILLNAVSAAVRSADIPWRTAVRQALCVEPQKVDDMLCRMRSTGLLGPDDTPTALGAAELERGSSAIAAITSDLVDGIDEPGQAITRTVLKRIGTSARDLLASPPYSLTS